MKKIFIINLFCLVFIAIFIFLMSLVVPTLLKFINFKDEKVEFKKSLGETLKYHRTFSKMTKEFMPNL